MKKRSDCDCRGYIDLHIHSTFSDGTFTPLDILMKASQIGLKAISITDHDTLEGSKSALALSIPEGLQLISGVEVSVSPPGGFGIFGGIHIIGYGVRVNDSILSKNIDLLKKYRLNRNLELIRSLGKLGIVLSQEEVFEAAGRDVVGRPHFANIMVKNGFAHSFDDAFDRFLGYGKVAYVRKKKVSISDFITCIKNAGGVPILAHPSLINIKNPNTFKKFVLELKALGLMGIEAIYPQHSRAMTDFYCNLAYTQELIITGGTDFHGDVNHGLGMGFGRGNFSVPFSLYEKLLKVIDRNL